MKKTLPILLIAVFLLCATHQTSISASTSKADPAISGTVVSGYRILPIQKSTGKIHLTVFRGDYIKFKFDGAFNNPVLTIPALSVEQKLSDNLAEAPYFKMKKTGAFPFSLGQMSGDITVIEYRQPNYREVTAKEAAKLIKNIQPLILDVRTSGEYKRGHLKKAVLIPVQELQSRYKEISGYKNQDILIYCATGNRSTVAAKILIDKGFKRIFNMRYGVYEWSRYKFPVISGS
jgi:rhodanese-related sulfurtransferase